MENTLDLTALLSGLGSDPSTLGAIAELLKGMNSGSTHTQQPNATAEAGNFPQFTAPSPQHQPPQSYPNSQAATPQGSSGLSPELLGTLLSALGNTPPKPPQNQAGGNQGSIEKLLGGKTESENRVRLLNALRPYLSEERRSKLDLIMKLLKIAELGKLSGLLSSV